MSIGFCGLATRHAPENSPNFAIRNPAQFRPHACPGPACPSPPFGCECSGAFLARSEHVPSRRFHLALPARAGGQAAVRTGTNWLGTVRGRLGYGVTPTLLVFGTGGVAYGGIRASATHSSISIGTLTGANDALFPQPFPYSIFNGTHVVPSIPGAANYSGTRVGWTAGGGIEWMFMPNWSLKAEGLYYDLGSVALQSSSVNLLSPLTINLGGINVRSGQLLVANAPITRVRFGGVIARVGINYHFTWGAPAPVVARY